MADFGIIGGVSNNANVAVLKNNDVKQVKTYVTPTFTGEDEFVSSKEKEKKSVLGNILKTALIVGGTLLGAKFLKNKAKTCLNSLQRKAFNTVNKVKTVVNEEIKPILQKVVSKTASKAKKVKLEITKKCFQPHGLKTSPSSIINVIKNTGIPGQKVAITSSASGANKVLVTFFNDGKPTKPFEILLKDLKEYGLSL